MLQQLKAGYAYLLDAPAASWDQPGFTLVETPARTAPAWAGWVQLIWLFALGDAVVASVAPHYGERVRGMFESVRANDLLRADVLERARTLISDCKWVQCELFYYPNSQPPPCVTHHHVEVAQPGDAGAERLLRNFDGGVYVIRDAAGNIASHVGIKDKGKVHEIAVGTEAEYRQRGMGRAVVTHAIDHILRRGKVPVYCPDSLTNRASYALAHSVGLQKVATMLFCTYERPDWMGFPLPASYSP